MDEEARIREFMKPACPVKIGDRFYKNYHVPNNLVFYHVTDIREVEDENGTFYAVTAESENIAIGANTKVFSSRWLTSGDYTIIRKRGVDY